MNKSFSHFDEFGNPAMVDVSEKQTSKRIASASAIVKMNKKTLLTILDKNVSKGNVLDIANIAGIQAAKNTSQLIPLCHPLQLSHIKIIFEPDKNNNKIKITSEISCDGKTGVEMEALTAVCTAALTIYDMCKSLDKRITINDVHLIHKSGGKSGVFHG